MVFQSFNLFNNLTVLENCMIGQTKVLKRSKEEAKQKCHEVSGKGRHGTVHQCKARSRSPADRSSDVAIARALAMEPEVLLFDETDLRAGSQMVGEVLAVMRTLAREGITMIIVTHEMAFARMSPTMWYSWQTESLRRKESRQISSAIRRKQRPRSS